ncbi:hypothetical protein [Roseiflexus sp.]|uniref:hypothetical protein n=1 Tax=Roseiflexus sp. TaxID=2562120 RepID=UPI00398AEA86
MNVMETYNLTLALQDYMPILFSIIGLYFISRMVRTIHAQLGTVAIVGSMLIFIGGFLKATWKLLMALTESQVNIVWFDKGMFLWMAPGFTLVAFSLWLMRQVQRGALPQRMWLGPGVTLVSLIVAILFTGFPDPAINTWRFILLGVMTIGNVGMVILLIQQARDVNQNRLAALFIVHIIIIFVLSGLARLPDQSIPLQWTEQLLNTFAQGIFVYAAWKLSGLAASTPVISTTRVRMIER